MNEEQLRALVREAIAKHVGPSPSAASGHLTSPAAPSAALPSPGHPSHGLFVLRGDDSGACLIEPAVRCNHCGYCKSMGH